MAWTIVGNVQRLRVVLCLHPDSTNFSERLHAYPSLLSHTTVFWLESGTSENQTALAGAALQSHAAASPQQAPADMLSSEITSCHIDGEQMIPWLQAVHAAAGDWGLAAPSHFAVLVRQTLSIIRTKEADALKQIDFLHVCLCPLYIAGAGSREGGSLDSGRAGDPCRWELACKTCERSRAASI